MRESDIQSLIETQRSYFLSGATLPVARRLDALRRLQEEIVRREEEIHEALLQDLGKCNFESYMCETGLTLSELSYQISHLRRFAREKRVPTPLTQFLARSTRKPSPQGVVLIMSPWNYPFLLTMEPLADALAAGNTCLVKPSAYSPHVSAVVADLLQRCFPPEQVAVVTGGRTENTCLLRQKFDYIFFTGSQAVGREVLRQAAEHLTPVTLELGGKSPCVVDRTADLKLAARRIVFGKYLNCGQTCVAPDFVYCDAAVRDELTDEIVREIARQYGERPLDGPDYGHMINEKHFDRVMGLITPEKVIAGGVGRRETLQIAPTVLADVTFDDPVMGEEIFGPVLPILTFTDPEEAIRKLQTLPHPLALYVFTRSKKTAEVFTSRIGFGGGCINDTVVHLATSQLPFGGFGESGMGSYHGKAGFDTFSHYKSLLDKKLRPDLAVRYRPYRQRDERLMRRLLK